VKVSKSNSISLAQRCTRTSPHEIYAQALLRRFLHVIRTAVYVRYTSIDIALPLYFFLLFFVPLLFLLHFVVNKDVHKRVPCYCVRILSRNNCSGGIYERMWTMCWCL